MSIKKRFGVVAALILLAGVLATVTFSSAPAAGEHILTYQQIETLRNIEYAKPGGVSLKLDVCRPKGLTAVRSTVVLTHGGGFRRGSKSDLLDTCQELAKLGYVAATVDYRLAPKYPYPAQIDDVQYAARWLRANAQKYLIDPNNMGSWGGSAGGYLATMLGVQETRNSSLGLANYSSKVKVVIDRFGAPMDATDPSVVDPKSKYAELQAAIMKDYLRGYQITPDLLGEISPVSYATSDDAPLLAVHSVNDQLAPIIHSQKIVAALGKVRANAKLEPFEGKGDTHGLIRADPKEQERVWKLETDFLAQYLPLEPTPRPKPQPGLRGTQTIQSFFQRLFNLFRQR